ncbi:hypothetical protein OG539_22415 [Actinacidiphila glaucinigra]|nr:hypothetical protein OIE69_20365 [Actinacidiphila glaucinigra]
MHMNSAPHLLTEDRPEFERALDTALHSEGTRAALAEARNRLNAEQLRTMALNAAEPISACAAPEYEQFVKVREAFAEQRREARTATVPGLGYAAAAAPVAADGSGAGLFAVVAVLTPILAGTAAVIFLVLGYALRFGHPEPAIAQPLRQAGWLFAAVAVCGIVIGMVGLLLTALRNGSTALHDPHGGEPRDVALARELWRRALVERGLQPFLDDALAKAAGAAPTAPTAPSATTGGNPRMPRLGYSRPDFSSPGHESSPEPGDRFTSPDFSSPDFSSPDFGGPDHRPD